MVKWMIVREETLEFFKYLNKYFDFIEVIGGHEYIKGNSHDEAWEDNYYLTDKKYKDIFDIDRKIKEFDEKVGGWGGAYLFQTDTISPYWDDYYIRIKDIFFTMSSRDWSIYAETGKFRKRKSSDINAVLDLLAALDLKLPSSEEKENGFKMFCEDFLKARGCINEKKKFDEGQKMVYRQT